MTLTEKRTKYGTSYWVDENEEVILKQCSNKKCLEVKPLEEFNADPKGIGGKHPHCRKCKNKADKEHRQTLQGKIVTYEHNRDRILDEIEQKTGIKVERGLKRWHIATIYGYRECAYCGRDLTLSQVTIDHVRPPKQGGGDVFSNILPCCRPCNSKKGEKHLYTFLMEDVDEYYRKKVIFDLAQRHLLTYDQMEEQLKLDRTFNLYRQTWEQLEKEGLTHLFTDKDDFENKRRDYLERTREESTQGK